MWQLDFHFSCLHQCLGVKIILFDSVAAQSEKNNNIKIHTRDLTLTNCYKVTNGEVDKAHLWVYDTNVKKTKNKKNTVQNTKTSGKVLSCSMCYPVRLYSVKITTNLSQQFHSQGKQPH